MLRKHDLVAILATYPSTARVIRRKVIRHILREKVRLFVSLVARTRLMAGAAASSSRPPRHRPSKAELQSLLSAVCSTDGGLPLPVALLALRGATDRYARLLHATTTRIQTAWRARVASTARHAAAPCGAEPCGGESGGGDCGGGCGSAACVSPAELEPEPHPPAVGLLGGERVVLVYGPAPVGTQQV